MIRLTVLALAASGLLLAQPLPSALAQGAPTAPPPAEGRGKQAMQACRGDMVALCGGVAQGGGRKIGCLKDNQAKLSAPCQAAIQAVLDQRAVSAAVAAGPTGGRGGQRTQACQADVASVCASISPGQGGVAKCLKDHAALLSVPCQAVVAERAAKHAQVKAARATCSSDAATLCGDAANGRDAMQCLREKQALASSACQQALATLPTHRPRQAGLTSDPAQPPAQR